MFSNTNMLLYIIFRVIVKHFFQFFWLLFQVYNLHNVVHLSFQNYLVTCSLDFLDQMFLSLSWVTWVTLLLFSFKTVLANQYVFTSRIQQAFGISVCYITAYINYVLCIISFPYISNISNNLTCPSSVG